MSPAPITREDIEREASGKQHLASAPDVSSFVLANAGAGKTHLLVGRVIRLMLEGVQPERILCLTYTRAAAAEMSERLFRTLASWVAMDGEQLINEIHRKVGHVDFRTDELDKARRLFTRALETPGGLKVQTIHAFCERLLQRFPVEAGIMPGFSVLDDTMERELLARARDHVLEHGGEAADYDGRPVTSHVATVLNYAGEQSFEQLLRTLLHKRKLLVERYGLSNTFPALRAGLNLRLGLADSDDAEAIRLAFLKGVDWRDLSDAGDILAGPPSSTDRGLADAISQAINGAGNEEKFAAMCRLLLKKDGNPKASSSLATKAVNDVHPQIREMLSDLQEHCADALAKTRALAVRDATISVVAVGLAVIARYTQLKQDASAYDYADLIERTNELLTGSSQAAWVLYKLDKGLDHILIDEAQDTSPEQWDIINALTEEFFSGEGAYDEENKLRRTMFAVGDRKQSIYSFQGARPEIFDHQRRKYEARVSDAGGEFQPVELEISFRSAGRVLAAVDLVFANDDIAAGVQSPDLDRVKHIASRVKDDGLVEIWDILRDPPRESTDPWNIDVDDTTEALHDPANVRLAQRIARTISGWLNDEPLELLADGRPVRASDILILVRERSSLMEAIVRALKDSNVPVAGADRLDLLSHITAQDLMALGRFVILPEDDLNLASLLKSPLLARDDGSRFTDDDDIFLLARDRGTASLWQRFTGAVSSGAPYAIARDKLVRWRADATRHGVFRFFANVLSRDNGRADFLNAIGYEAGEPIDAFLQQCLEYERENLPSMVGFLGWLEEAAANLKRDMEQGAGEVRVMTVHGAKGLEAPIVFLPDTCKKPDGGKTSKIIVDDDADGLPVWHIKSDFEVAYTKQLKDADQNAMQQEYSRLLYVAMTRARDRLYVCGFLKSKKTKTDWRSDIPKEGTWYHAIHTALVDSGQDTVAVTQDDGLQVWRFGSGFITPPDKDTGIVRSNADITLDSWATDPVPPVSRPERWLAPSKLGTTAEDEDGWSREAALSPLAPSQDRRFRRGTLVHRLLQSLPELPPDAREAAARRYLSRQGVEGDALGSTVTEIMALFDDERFAEVFSAKARAEVSIAAMIDPPDAERFGLSGQIDRLLVTDSRVLVVDFKTNRPPPLRVEDVPVEYLRQLAAYAHMLREIFPGRSIECALLWTDAPELMAVPQSMLDQAWGEQVFTSA